MKWRCLLSVLATASLAIGPSVVFAQVAPTGTLTGHVIFCRPLPRPVAMDDLSDVTPGANRTFAPPLQLPAPDVQLSVEGTGISVTTDDNGGFALAGIPAAQPLTLVAQPVSGPPLVLNAPAPAVADGQTMDLGTLALGNCPGLPTSFTPQPDSDTDPNVSAD